MTVNHNCGQNILVYIYIREIQLAFQQISKTAVLVFIYVKQKWKAHQESRIKTKASGLILHDKSICKVEKLPTMKKNQPD